MEYFPITHATQDLDKTTLENTAGTFYLYPNIALYDEYGVICSSACYSREVKQVFVDIIQNPVICWIFICQPHVLPTHRFFYHVSH